MNITLYPFQPFTITPNKITVFSTNAVSVYTKLVTSLKTEQEALKISNEDYQLVDFNKNILWIGDLATADLNQLFQKQLLKKISNDLNDTQRQTLVQLDNQIRTAISDTILMYDLSLTVGQEWNISKLLKYISVKFFNSIQADPYGIIENIVKTVSELNNNKIIILMNVSHYLSISQFNELVRLIAALDVKLFIIEFLEKAFPKKYQDCRYYHIDRDYVEWRYD